MTHLYIIDAQLGLYATPLYLIDKVKALTLMRELVDRHIGYTLSVVPLLEGPKWTNRYNELFKDHAEFSDNVDYSDQTSS